MALHSARTWVDVSSYIHGLVSRHRISYGTGTFTERLLLLDYLSQLIFEIFRSSCMGFKASELPVHSKTDIHLISMFCGFRINTKNIALHKYASFIGVLISMTYTIEEVWNITTGRCESLPNNQFSPLWYSVWRNKS